jgi:plasmid maintenance system antidote protein VapI
VSPEFWMNLQTCFDLLTKQEDFGSEIQKLKTLKAA